MAKEAIEIPTLAVTAKSIPEAHYKAIDAVWNQGMTKRTQYDRKNSSGDFIDPPSRDARVMIHVSEPFAEPRFPALSHCERGKYILELMGAKDHLVLTPEEIRQGAAEDALDTRWPYTYSQRLREWPSDQGAVNQIDNVLDRLVDSLDTRRAVMSTRCPGLDVLLQEDLPCLGEVHLRALDQGDEVLLDMFTVWRSRDLFKAWADNVVAVTYFGETIAQSLGRRIERPTRLGAYTDVSNSLHIYGQDFATVEGDGEKRKSFFEVSPTVEDYIAKSMTGGDAADLTILPEMRELAQEQEWNFTPERVAIIQREISKLEQGQTP